MLRWQLMISLILCGVLCCNCTGIRWSAKSPTGLIPEPRAMHSAVVIDGKMLVYGGQTKAIKGFEPADLSGVRIYDPITDRWAWDMWAEGDTPSHRSGHTANVINGKMYIYGGENNGTLSSTDVWAYNPLEDSWEKLVVDKHPSGTVTVPHSMTRHSASTIGDRLYIFDGLKVVSPWHENRSEMFIFDTVTRVWSRSKAKRRPSPRYAHSAVVIDGLVYVFGGQIVDGELTNELHVFNPQKDLWSGAVHCTGDVPEPIQGHAAFVIGKKMFIHGNFNRYFHFGGSTGDMFVLDTEEFIWTKIETGFLRDDPSLLHHTVVEMGSELVAFGGRKCNKETINDVWVLPLAELPAQHTAPDVATTNASTNTSEDTGISTVDVSASANISKSTPDNATTISAPDVSVTDVSAPGISTPNISTSDTNDVDVGTPDIPESPIPESDLIGDHKLREVIKEVVQQMTDEQQATREQDVQKIVDKSLKELVTKIYDYIMEMQNPQS